MAIDSIRQMTVEEYFAFDEASEYKNEYIDGEVYPMMSGTIYHGIIIANASGALWQRLKGSDCRVISSDMRNRVNPTRYVYPDFSVVCGEPATDERAVTLWNPTLVAEVTSPSSIDTDRVVKRDYYATISSIQAYLEIDQHRVLVELYTRREDGWLLNRFSDLDAEVPLTPLECELPLTEIYEGISF